MYRPLCIKAEEREAAELANQPHQALVSTLAYGNIVLYVQT